MFIVPVYAIPHDNPLLSYIHKITPHHTLSDSDATTKQHEYTFNMFVRVVSKDIESRVHTTTQCILMLSLGCDVVVVCEFVCGLSTEGGNV